MVLAALCVFALGTTVYVALDALNEAEGTIIRGESSALLGELSRSLADEPSVGAAELERELAAHTDSGLRYLAVVEHGSQRVVAQAGHATMPSWTTRPNEPLVQAGRVRMAGVPLMGRARRGWRGAPGGPTGQPPWLRSGQSLVLEFEPPVLRTLRANLLRLSAVAGLCGAVVLTFAVAWSNNRRKLAHAERRAEHDQRLIALGRMSSVMAHELRNPLASLKGHAQLLVEELEDGPPKPLQRAERVVTEAERIEALTQSLLDFVRDGPLDRQPLTLRELLERSLRDLPSERVRLDLGDGAREVRVDAPRLSRALYNLIDNALQADPAGEVRVQAHADGQALQLSVEDHGAGIDPSIEHTLFDPFVTTRVRGTGLGLSVVRRVVEQHGGQVRFEPNTPHGARFLVHLPDAIA